MKGLWKSLFIGGLIAVSAVAYAAGAVDVPLRYISAETAYAVIKDTPGLDSMTIHLKENSLSFTGSEEGIAAAKSFLALMDVPPAQVTVSARLIRYERDASGNEREMLVQQPIITTANDRQASMATSGAGTNYQLIVTPHVNRDGTVTMSTELDELGGNGSVRKSAWTVRRLRQNTPQRLTGLTTSADMLLRHAVEAGEIVANRGPYDAVYADVTVQRVTPGGGK